MLDFLEPGSRSLCCCKFILFSLSILRLYSKFHFSLNHFSFCVNMAFVLSSACLTFVFPLYYVYCNVSVCWFRIQLVISISISMMSFCCRIKRTCKSTTGTDNGPLCQTDESHRRLGLLEEKYIRKNIKLHLRKKKFIE